MKEKKKFNVDQPLKRINWNKVQTQRLKENSFWVNANEEKYASDDILQILLENFSTKPSKTSNYILSKLWWNIVLKISFRSVRLEEQFG